MRGWLAIMLGMGCGASPPPAPECTLPGAVPKVDGFDFPVGAPDADGYRNAQPFGENHHTGDDWNGLGGGDTDLGDPVYSIAHGRVTAVGHQGEGWGNVVRVAHRMTSGLEEVIVESFYAHLQSSDVSVGDIVFRGQQIARIGNADGVYYAHLHFEIRDAPCLPDGRGYDDRPRGYLDPTAFIATNRPR